MTDPTLRARAIALYDRFTHEGRDRRAFMADMTKLAGSLAAAEALVAGIAASPAAATVVPADDRRIIAETLNWEVGGRALSGYAAKPAVEGPAVPHVMVIHENRGLTDHIRDVARQLAVAGFRALAPDFLSPGGGTPADEDRARTMIGALDLAVTVRDALGTLAWLRLQRGGTGKVGAVGFCWGGALVDRLAVAGDPALAAGVSYYGPAPDPAEAARVQAPLMIHLAGEDARVNATAVPFVDALRQAGKDVTLYNYPGVNHAFNNDTSAERYDAVAARAAWDRTLAFFAGTLGRPATVPAS